MNELGTEGRLISMQLEELIDGVEEDAWFLLKDYARDNTDEKIREIRGALKKLNNDELLKTPI